MKKTITALFFLAGVCAQAQQLNGTLARPKLVVGIVVDQMRWDYLYRYYDRYGAGGFRRLLNEGFSCENTYIPYVPTVTAIGHSTVYTGSVPAIHGITGNDFFIESTGQKMYCTEDSTVETVGSSSVEGRMSPRNLMASTITDELRLATNFRSKVVGVALKDRGSILPAGHTPTAAYWFDDATGNWITSTYYMKELPRWVKDFNQQKPAEKYLKEDWKTLYKIATYVQSTDDDNAYEGLFAGSKTPTFPVRTSTMYSRSYSILRTTPYGNTLTAAFAKAAIENESLGVDAITDFLAVSFSSTDYIGHKFGVNAIETEDTYLRLDKELAAFFKFLDSKVGKGAYTVFLTADHGAAHNPNFLQDHRIPAGYFNSGAVQKQLNAALEKTYGFENIVRSLAYLQVHLNNALIQQQHLDERAIRKDIVDFLRKTPQVLFVVDNDKTGASGLPATLAERIRNGYNAKRSGVITFVLEPAYYSGSSTKATGTTHGSAYAYDTHIPLLWMGWGIKRGSSNREVTMADIAPTLAALLHIQEPNGCVGQPIEEVIAK